MMDFTEIEDNLKKAADEIVENDWYLLEHDINERSISHMLACYLADVFPDHDVDCEYNSNVLADTEKKYIRMLRDHAAELGLLRETDSEEEIIDRNVYPDIIVHKRGDSGHNLLIIEMKKTSSTVPSDYDIEKLRRYTSPDHDNKLNYSFGAFICIGVRENAGEYSIKWYQNGERIDIQETSNQT